MASLLAAIGGGTANDDTPSIIAARLQTIADGARCNLARQHQAVVGRLVRLFDADIDAQHRHGAASVPVELVAELVALDESGAHLDASFAARQPDWTSDPVDSGKTPPERYAGQPGDGAEMLATVTPDADSPGGGRSPSDR